MSQRIHELEDESGSTWTVTTSFGGGSTVRDAGLHPQPSTWIRFTGPSGESVSGASRRPHWRMGDAELLDLLRELRREESGFGL